MGEFDSHVRCLPTTLSPERENLHVYCLYLDGNKQNQGNCPDNLQWVNSCLIYIFALKGVYLKCQDTKIILRHFLTDFAHRVTSLRYFAHKVTSLSGSQ